MFGFRKTRAANLVHWAQLLSLLEDDDLRAAVQRVYPHPGRESFLNWLRRIDATAAEQVVSAGRQLDRAASLADQPTVAVAGMLNSGKTSLVASFLSPQGRARTLRGANNREGTHRFVLWLPEAWRGDPDLWGLLVARIGDALGQPPEMLDDDPLQAHRQYNNQAGDAAALGVPLVATDPGLDEAGVGLLDCPDIVSDSSFGLGAPETRRALLGRAATLCSAFLVVTTPESFRDTTLADLLRIASDLMPGVPRLLAVNKIRPRQTPDQVWETFQPLADQYRVESVYAAYDFDVPASGPFIPGSSQSPDRYEVQSTDQPLPVFFSLSPDPDANPPAAIPDDRLLTSLPQLLDRARLFDRFRISLESGLRTAVWDEGLDRLHAAARAAAEEALQVRKMLLAAALEFFAHREPGGRISELRLHQSERIVRQLSEAFSHGAPWYARWGVRLSTAVKRVIGGAGDLLRQLTPTAVARKTAGEIKEVFSKGEQGGILTPDRLQQALRLHGAVDRLPDKPDPQAVAALAAEALQRFERDDFTSLDPRRLDAAVREMWREVPISKKLQAGLTPLAAVLAGFGAVLMIPLDFGGTTVALSASIPELLAAAGLSAFATYWSGRQSANSVGQQAARQQLADFLAVLCDTFGVPRGDQPMSVEVAGRAAPLPPPNIAQRPPDGPALLLWRVRQEFEHELNQQLPRETASK